MTDLTDLILQEANECEMLGGLAATHDERVRYRERAEKLRCLASEARRARVILESGAHGESGAEARRPVNPSLGQT